MKKLLLTILCIVLLVSLAVPVFAAGTVSVTPSSSTVHRGETFAVLVTASGWGNCSTGSIEVSYGNAFELISGEWLVPAPDIGYFDVAGREGGFAYSSAKALSGNIAKLVFRVKNGAAFATDKITVGLKLGGSQISKAVDVVVSCSHQFSNWAYYSATTHIRRCNICGKAEVVEHSYDNDCDTTCNACGTERTITHKFGEDWTGDESGHWHECTVCGEKDSVDQHVPGEEAGEYTDQVCTVCKYVMVPALGHTHRYDENFSHDEKGHWQICTGCKEATEAEAHGFDGDCDESCDKCGYQRQITHALGPWEYTEEDHWKTCSNCSQKLEEGLHSWDAGYVKKQATTQKAGLIVYHCTECMAERQEVIPKALPTDPAGGWAWWLWLSIGAGGGAILVALIFTMVIVLKVKKKSKGRFSG